MDIVAVSLFSGAGGLDVLVAKTALRLIEVLLMQRDMSQKML